MMRGCVWCPGQFGSYMRRQQCLLQFLFSQAVALWRFGTWVPAAFCGQWLQWQCTFQGSRGALCICWVYLMRLGLPLALVNAAWGGRKSSQWWGALVPLAKEFFPMHVGNKCFLTGRCRKSLIPARSSPVGPWWGRVLESRRISVLWGHTSFSACPRVC